MSKEYLIDRQDLVKVIGSESEVDGFIDALRVAANKRRAGHPAYKPAEEVLAEEAPENLEVQVTDKVGASDVVAETEQGAEE